MGFHASPSAGSPFNPKRQARMKQSKHKKVQVRLGLLLKGCVLKQNLVNTINMTKITNKTHLQRLSSPDFLKTFRK